MLLNRFMVEPSFGFEIWQKLLYQIRAQLFHLLQNLIWTSVRADVFVAPYAGAWIETGYPHLCQPAGQVAPYAGAWIETGYPHLCQPAGQVAPYAGAWIETSCT